MFDILLNRTDSVDKLLKQADALNIDVRIGNDGKINAHALKKTPETVKWNQQFAQQIKQNRKLVEYAITEKGWPDVFSPPSLEDRAKTAENALIPSTGAGRGAVGGLAALDMLAPEMSFPLQLLTRGIMGIGGGMVGGGITGQPLGDSAKTGAVATATDLGLRGIVKGGKYLKDLATRPGRLDREMMANIGSIVKDHLEKFAPKAAQKIISAVSEFGRPGKDTVVRVLNSPEANAELAKHYQDTLKTVKSQVVQDARNDVLNLATRFKKTYGVTPTKKNTGVQATAQMLKDLNEFEVARDDARTIGKELDKAFDDVAASTRGSYDTDNQLKHSYSAIKGVQNKTQLKDKIDELVSKADPTKNLSNMLEKARDNYSKFSGFQDFVNQTNVMDKKGRFFNAQTLQKSVDGNTNPAVRFIQRRLKDAFEPLVAAVRRNAEPFDTAGKPQISDNPLWAKDESIRAGGGLPGMGRYFMHVPSPRMLGHYIGESGKPSFNAQTVGQLPVLLNSLATQLTETPDKKQGPQ